MAAPIRVARAGRNAYAYAGGVRESGTGRAAGGSIVNSNRLDSFSSARADWKVISIATPRLHARCKSCKVYLIRIVGGPITLHK
jgi:hypothetical protein